MPEPISTPTPTPENSNPGKTPETPVVQPAASETPPPKVETPKVDPAKQEPAKPANVDLTKLSSEQLAKVLENPELFKQPRIKDLLDAQKELKKFQAEQQQREETALVEQKKFEELAEKRRTENETLQRQLTETKINQALSNKLVGMKTVDLDGALKLVSRNEIKVEDDGTVSGVDKALEALKTDKPYLFEKPVEQPAPTPAQPKVGAPSNPNNGNNPGVRTTFKRSEIRDMDHKTYQENRTAILQAQREGRIEDDISSRGK